MKHNLISSALHYNNFLILSRQVNIILVWQMLFQCTCGFQMSWVISLISLKGRRHH